MFAFAVGITIVAVGVLFIVWAGVFNNGRGTSTVREELEKQRSSNRSAQQSIAGAESTVESLSDGIREEDRNIRESIDRISEATKRISEAERSDREILKEVRKRKVNK